MRAAEIRRFTRTMSRRRAKSDRKTRLLAKSIKKHREVFEKTASNNFLMKEFASDHTL
jgi:hypothetical protein